MSEVPLYLRERLRCSGVCPLVSPYTVSESETENVCVREREDQREKAREKEKESARYRLSCDENQ